MDTELNEIGLRLEKFIQQHISSEEDLHQLALQKLPCADEHRSLVLQTIDAYRKLRLKIPRWYPVQGLLFGPKQSIEQASSEQTALFKASLLSRFKITNGVDLTGGLGADSYFLAEKAEKWTYVERNAELVRLFDHNLKMLNQSHIECVQADAVAFIQQDQFAHFDFIFVDPDRRPKDLGRRAVGFDESVPDIRQIAQIARTYRIPFMVKSSPMIDLNEGQKRAMATEVYVVSVKNEVKEILWLFEPKLMNRQSPEVHIVELTYEWDEVSAPLSASKPAVEILSSTPKDGYLIIPSAGIMKGALQDVVAAQFRWKKLANFTHIYFSEQLPASTIPARVFRVIQEVEQSPKKFRKTGLKSTNIICRNTPFEPSDILKKYRLKEGGEDYLICFRDADHHVRIMHAERV